MSIQELCVSTERDTFTLGDVTLWFPKEIPLTTLRKIYDGSSDDPRHTYAKLVVLMAENEDGTKRYQPDDWQPLFEKGKSTLARLFQFVEQRYLLPVLSLDEGPPKNQSGLQS